MSNVREFRNSAPKKINLLRWFTIGVIISLIIAIDTCIQGGGIDLPTIIRYPLIGGFPLITFRKWIFRTLWA